jgi:dihydrofolate synthase/folylpolyglutamate synthase
MNSYEEALDWLYARQLFGIKLGLENMRRLAAALGHPEKSLRFLHVAGTNGKGSVCAVAEAILRAHGVRTGLFTSPHLVDFTERLRVDGQEIPRDAVVSGLTRLRLLIEGWEPGPTFFELVCALALEWFHAQEVEVVVWETGMGGRLDATNIVQPGVCVITPIGLDHQRWLGDTLPDIAREKAGIIKPGVPVVCLPQEKAACDVLQTAAATAPSPFFLIQKPWRGPLGLAGNHQRWNAAGALAACKIILPDLREQEVEQALAGVVWPARFQWLAKNIILDGAHNPAAAKVLATTWQEEFSSGKAHLIFGALADKAVAEVLAELLPLAEEVFFVPVRSPRSLTPEALQGMAGRGVCCQSVPEALALAQKNSGAPMLIAGSLFLAGEVLAHWQGVEPPLPGLQ